MGTRVGRLAIAGGSRRRRPGPGIAPTNRFYAPDPPVVHFLMASSGAESHTIAGLSWPKTADLDGDGLADLWGSVEGKLRAFRAEPPEAWRALDRLHAAGDLDGDGIVDVMSNDFESPRVGPVDTMESRTLLTRSGRDGRILWRTPLDPWEKWVFWQGLTGAYGFYSLPLPGGDLDGDGAPDVVVRKGQGPAPGYTKLSALPVEALSGRTGRSLWTAGPLPPSDQRPYGGPYIEGIDVRVCDPRGLPDVLVLYDLAYLAGSIKGRAFDSHSHLTRLSGRDGGVIWDVLLAEHQGGMTKLNGFVHEVADLDGDGNLEIVLLLKSKAATGSTPRELRSLITRQRRDARWRHQLNQDAAVSAGLAVGDLDGDGRPEVIVREQPRQGIKPAIEVTALDGQAGKLLWTWSGGEAHDESDKNPPPCLARFDNSGRRDVCVSFGIARGRRRVVILDARGPRTQRPRPGIGGYANALERGSGWRRSRRAAFPRRRPAARLLRRSQGTVVMADSRINPRRHSRLDRKARDRSPQPIAGPRRRDRAADLVGRPGPVDSESER